MEGLASILGIFVFGPEYLVAAWAAQTQVERLFRASREELGPIYLEAIAACLGEGEVQAVKTR